MPLAIEANQGVAADPPASMSTEDDVARRVLGSGVILAVAAFVVQSVSHLVDWSVFDLDVEIALAESDSSAWAWASIVTTFAVAVGALLLYCVQLGRPLRLLALAGAVAFLSLDDMVQVHERTAEWVTELGVPAEWHLARLIWPALFFPLLALTFLLLWEISRAMREPFRRALLWGAGLLVAAIALEALSPPLFWLGFDHGDLVYELQVVAEEGAELAGWALVATSLFAWAVAQLERSGGRADVADNVGEDPVEV